MKERKDFAGVFLMVSVLLLMCGSIHFRIAYAQEGQDLVVKKPFVMYVAQSRQGGVFDFNLNKVEPNTKYSSLALDSPVAVLEPDVSSLSDTDIKNSFELWSPVILLGRERAVLSCYFAPNSKEYLDNTNCKAPLSLGKDRGRAVMMGYLALITPNPNNQNESFFAFVPDDGANPVFGEKEILPTPTPYPTETPVPVLEPTPSVREVENVLSSEGLETITAEKQMPLGEWIERVAKERGIDANDLRVINGANYDDNGKVVGSPSVQSRKVGGVKIPFTGIYIGGKPYTIPGESTLLVPRRQLLDGLEIVDLEPAVLEIARRAGKDISARFSTDITHIILHDTAIESRLAPPIDIEDSCIKKFGIPCYNFIVDTNGTIYKIRSVGYIYIGAGRSFDEGSVAISFNTSPTVSGGVSNDVQQDAAIRLVTYLAKQYGIDPLGVSALGSQNNLPHISGHRSLLGATHVDPVGVDLEGFARKVADLLAGSSSIAENSPKLVAPTPQTVATAVPQVKDTSSQGFIRALWVDVYHSGIESKATIDELVRFSSENQVDLLFVQVRRRDEAYFYSGIIGKALPKGFDSLKYLLEKATPLGIKVHAWVDGGWMYPEEGPDYTKADVQEYLKGLITPLLKYKDLAGVHLDRIRYSGKTTTEAQRTALTSLIEEVHSMTRASGKELSVAVVAWGAPPEDNGFEFTSPYNEVGQDWGKWVSSRFVDMLVPMDYHESESWYRGWVDYQAEICKAYDIPLVVGVPDYMLSTSADVQRYAEYAISAGANGIAYYSYASMVEKGRLLPSLPSTQEVPKATDVPPRIKDSIPGQPASSTTGEWQLPVRREDLAFVCRTAADHRAGSNEVDPAMDFCAREGTKIYPIGVGKVIWSSVGNESGLGEWVQVFHPSADNPNAGIISTYAHLNQVFVHIGDEVTFDSVLGTIGWAGATSFGPHVHVAVENAPSGKWREGAPKLGQDDMLDGDAFFKELIAGLSYCKMCNVP